MGLGDTDGDGILDTTEDDGNPDHDGVSKDKVDCFDENALAFPGATGFQTVDRGDGSSDYTCDGETTPSIGVFSCLFTTAGTDGIFCDVLSTGTAGPAACGAAVTVYNSCIGAAPASACLATCTPDPSSSASTCTTGIQSCR